jgi:dTDP-4-amino-4,6-dideoxygalactose transaminase
MSAYDYPGNFLSIHALGAMPVLVDAAADHGNLDVAGLDQAIGTRTRAVLVSHLHGGIVPMDAVNELARARGVPVVEDVAQCPGATYHGRPLGSWGDVAGLSFGGSKLLTAGRGGAIITNRPDICQRARTFQNRGNLYCPISELQAAVLLPQLAKLDDRNAHRARQVILLRQLIDDLPGFRPFINQEIDCHPAYYKVGFHFDESSAGMSRSEMVQAAQAEGISLDAGFRALHVGRAPNRYRAPDDLPHATRMHAATLVLHHPVLLACPATMEELAAGLRKIINYHQEKRS